MDKDLRSILVATILPEDGAQIQKCIERRDHQYASHPYSVLTDQPELWRHATAGADYGAAIFYNFCQPDGDQEHQDRLVELCADYLIEHPECCIIHASNHPFAALTRAADLYPNILLSSDMGYQDVVNQLADFMGSRDVEQFQRRIATMR